MLSCLMVEILFSGHTSPAIWFMCSACKMDIGGLRETTTFAGSVTRLTPVLLCGDIVAPWYSPSCSGVSVFSALAALANEGHATLRATRSIVDVYPDELLLTPMT